MTAWRRLQFSNQFHITTSGQQIRPRGQNFVAASTPNHPFKGKKILLSERFRCVLTMVLDGFRFAKLFWWLVAPRINVLRPLGSKCTPLKPAPRKHVGPTHLLKHLFPLRRQGISKTPLRRNARTSPPRATTSVQQRTEKQRGLVSCVR